MGWFFALFLAQTSSKCLFFAIDFRANSFLEDQEEKEKEMCEALGVIGGVLVIICFIGLAICVGIATCFWASGGD